MGYISDVEKVDREPSIIQPYLSAPDTIFSWVRGGWLLICPFVDRQVPLPWGWLTSTFTEIHLYTLVWRKTFF